MTIENYEIKPAPGLLRLSPKETLAWFMQQQGYVPYVEFVHQITEGMDKDYTSWKIERGRVFVSISDYKGRLVCTKIYRGLGVWKELEVWVDDIQLGEPTFSVLRKRFDETGPTYGLAWKNNYPDLGKESLSITLELVSKLNDVIAKHKTPQTQE